MKKHQKDFEENREDSHIREFLDMIAPSVIWFETDHFICGNTYRCVWAIREYPTATDEQAILSHLGEKDGVTLHIYTRHVTAMEEKKPSMIFPGISKSERSPALSAQTQPGNRLH